MKNKLGSFARLCAWLQLEAVSFIKLKFDKKWNSLQISCHIDDDVKNSARNIKGGRERMREKTIQGGELILNEVDKSIFEMWSPLCLNLPWGYNPHRNQIAMRLQSRNRLN